MSNMITDYGMRVAFAAANSKTQTTTPPEAVDAMMDAFLRAIPDEGILHGDTGIKVKGTNMTARGIIDVVEANVAHVRLKAVRQFETYFTHGTEPEKILRDYNSGEEEARRTLRQMCVFPLEAMSVRGEIAHPRLITINAKQHWNDITGVLNITEFLEDSVMAEIRGPHLPPLPPAKIAHLMMSMIPYLDQQARAYIAGTASPPTSRMN